MQSSGRSGASGGGHSGRANFSTSVKESQIQDRKPKREDMQLITLKALMSFQCRNCKKVKQSKRVVVVSDNYSNLFCNTCYGNILFRKVKEKK